MNKFFETVEEYLKNSNMTKEEKVAFIKAAGEFYRQQVDKEYNNYVRNQQIGAGIEIASAVIPGSVGVKAAAKIAPKVIQKTIGRKLTNDITAGALNGAMSGGVYGFGEGITENKNPILNSTQKATEGLLTGGLTSQVFGNIKKSALGNNLKSYGNIDNLNQEARKNYNKEARKFYQDYVQGISLNKDGNIDFTRAGIQENLRWTPHQGQNLSSLINDIKKAQKLPNEPNLKIEQKPFVSHYEVYRGNLGDHYIEKLNDGGRRYYITKDTLDGTHQSTNLGSIKSANNIIPSFLSDFNLPKWVNPQTATLGQIINNNIQNNIPSFDFNTVVTTRGNNQQTPEYDKVFTPEDIGKMTLEEFSKNEKIINEQLQQGLITPTTQRKQNYSGYKNPVSGDNRIFSQEDIGDFSSDEFAKHEKEIRGQWGSIGIPANNELQSSGAIYIAPYTRSDGVQVKGHYRSR